MSEAGPFLPFTHSKLTLDRTLKTFEGYLGWLVQRYYVSYTPDWRLRHNRMQDREPEDTPEDRALWFRQILGTAMAYGMDLPTTSHPDPVELVPAVARWAHGALLHIRDLQRDIARLHGERLAVDLEHQQRQAASAQRIAELTEDANRSAASLAEANDSIAALSAKARELRDVREQNERTVDKLKAQLDALASEARRADSERDAWRMTATATSAALETLRAALRIPAGPVTGPAEVVDAIDPSDIAKTSLVRR